MFCISVYLLKFRHLKISSLQFDQLNEITATDDMDHSFGWESSTSMDMSTDDELTLENDVQTDAEHSETTAAKDVDHLIELESSTSKTSMNIETTLENPEHSNQKALKSRSFQAVCTP